MTNLSTVTPLAVLPPAHTVVIAVQDSADPTLRRAQLVPSSLLPVGAVTAAGATAAVAAPARAGRQLFFSDFKTAIDGTAVTDDAAMAAGVAACIQGARTLWIDEGITVTLTAPAIIPAPMSISGAAGGRNDVCRITRTGFGDLFQITAAGRVSLSRLSLRHTGASGSLVLLGGVGSSVTDCLLANTAGNASTMLKYQGSSQLVADCVWANAEPTAYCASAEYIDDTVHLSANNVLRGGAMAGPGKGMLFSSPVAPKRISNFTMTGLRCTVSGAQVDVLDGAFIGISSCTFDAAAAHCIAVGGGLTGAFGITVTDCYLSTSAAPATGVAVQAVSTAGVGTADLTVSRNTIVFAGTGVAAGASCGRLALDGNTLHDVATGLSIQGVGSARVTANYVNASGAALLAADGAGGGAQTYVANEFDGTATVTKTTAAHFSFTGTTGTAGIVNDTGGTGGGTGTGTGVSAGTITLTERPALAVYQRDTRAGGAFGQGAGAITWTPNASAAGAAIYYRLRNALAAGNPVLVPATSIVSAAVAGPQQVTIATPCGPYRYLIDWRLGTSGDWTLGTAGFSVGEVLAVAGQSLADRLAHDFTSTSIASLGLTTPVLHSVFETWYDPAFNGPAYDSALSWGPSGDGLTINSAFPGALASRWLTASGVPVGVIGFSQGATGIDTWQPGGGDYVALQTVLAAAGGRFGTFLWFQGHSDSQGGMSAATYTARLTTLINALKSDFPASAAALKVLIASIPNITSGVWGTGAQIEAIRQGAIDYCNANAGFAVHITPLDIPLLSDGTHETQLGTVTVADHVFRAMRGALGLDGNGDAGPRLTGVASRAAGSGTIMLTVAQAGGTSCVAIPDLATVVNQFQVFLAGTATSAGVVASVAFPSATQIAVTVAPVPADNVVLGLHYRMPPDASAAVYVSGIYDNNTADGLPHGRQLQMFPGEITVPAPAGSAVAPGPVGNLAVVAVTSSTIAVSYSPSATGSAPITYTGETSTNGTVWVANAAPFASTGGVFTNLAASTAYAVRIHETNATGGSVTVLSGSVTTSAAPVVPSGPALPAVGATPVAPLVHLDASTISGASGASMATVPDVSGSGNSYGQTVVAKQPLLQLAAVNGLNALRFVNASGTTIVNATTAWLAGLNASDLTMILVTKLLNPTPGGTGVGFYIGDSTGAYGMFDFEDWSGNPSTFAARVAGGDSFAGPLNLAAQTLGKKIIRWTEAANTYSYLLNAQPEQLTGVGPNAVAWTNAAIGTNFRAGNFTPDMLFCEFVVWPGVATNAQRDALMSYMTGKWGS